MKNTTKLIALTFLIGASCASLYSMEKNPQKREREEPASPEAPKRSNTPPAQTPNFMAEKKEGWQIKKALLGLPVTKNHQNNQDQQNN